MVRADAGVLGVLLTLAPPLAPADSFNTAADAAGLGLALSDALLAAVLRVSGLFGRLDVFSLALPAGGVPFCLAMSLMCANEPRRTFPLFEDRFLILLLSLAGIEAEKDVETDRSAVWSMLVSRDSNAAVA